MNYIGQLAVCTKKARYYLKSFFQQLEGNISGIISKFDLGVKLREIANIIRELEFA
jgi:hypothetical protein